MNCLLQWLDEWTEPIVQTLKPLAVTLLVESLDSLLEPGFLGRGVGSPPVMV